MLFQFICEAAKFIRIAQPRHMFSQACDSPLYPMEKSAL